MKTLKIKSHLFALAVLPCLTLIQASNSYASSFSSARSYQVLENSDIQIPRTALHQQMEQAIKDPQTTVEYLKSLIISPAFKGQSSTDSFEIIRGIKTFLKIEDIFDVFQKYPNQSGTIMRYIDPQDDGEPIWQSVNRKLRNGETMIPEQAQFTKDLTSALKTFPSVQVISYRGASLQQKYFDLYQEGQIYIDKAFSSTSLDPEIASSFAGSADPANRWSTVFIIYGKSGRFISLFRPENIHEQEILFAPSTPFKVIKKFVDAKTRSAVIVIQE